MHEAQEGLKAVSTTARELLERQRANQKDLEAVRAALEETEAEQTALEVMRDSSSPFVEGSQQDIVTLTVVNEQRLEQARAQLARAEAEAKLIETAYAQLSPNGKSLEELAAGEEVQSRVQEARVVAAQIVANEAEHNYVQERVRPERPGFEHWEEEILAAKEGREPERVGDGNGLVELVSDEMPVEGSSIYHITQYLAPYLDKKGERLEDPMLLAELVANYHQLPENYRTMADKLLPPEVKAKALLAYDFYQANEMRDEMELDRSLSRDMYGPVIPDQQTPEPQKKPEAEKANDKLVDNNKPSPKKDVWTKIEEQQSANYTPNVWQSPHLAEEICESGGEYETAMSVEEQVSSQNPASHAPAPKC
ncbi:MAG: hypothetical protein R3F23_05970 [Verrucomicrobiia bacterium]